MNRGWIVFLVLAGTGTGVYLYYRSQKKAKPIIIIPALAPTVAPTATWLEALKALVSPAPAVAEAVSVAPIYKAPVPTYKAPAPKYEPSWWGIPGGGVPSK